MAGTKSDTFPTMDDVLRRQAAHALGMPLSATWAEIHARKAGTPAGMNDWLQQRDAAAAREVAAFSPRNVPLTITLPWSCLVSENKRFVPALRGAKAVLVMTDEYRVAKAKTDSIARHVLLGHALPVFAKGVAVAVESVVWAPRDYNLPDVTNFAKATHDALQEITYEKDAQVHDSRWRYAGVDIDRPRAELTITPMEP